MPKDMNAKLHINDVVEHRKTKLIGRVTSFAHDGTTDFLIDGGGPYKQSDFVKLVSQDGLCPACHHPKGSDQDNCPTCVIQSWSMSPVTQPCICITHKDERYHHPQCTSFHNTKAVGYVGGMPYKTQLFQGVWPHGTLVETYDDRCQQCKEFDNDGCPNCGPNTIKKVFDPAEDTDTWYKNTEQLNIENLGPCPYENKLCPQCKQELKPCPPSGWSCVNGHGY